VAYVQRLLAGEERKNSWTLSEHDRPEEGNAGKRELRRTQITAELSTDPSLLVTDERAFGPNFSCC